MRRLIVLTAVISILLVGGGQQQAWAGNKTRQTDDDYRAFKKIVHILDDLINDDYRRRRNHVRVRRYSFPRRVCYYKGPYEVCHFDRYGYHRHGHKPRYKKYLKRRYHDDH